MTVTTAQEPVLRAKSIPVASGRRASVIRGWTARGALAVLDQGLAASGNLLLSVLLARWLDPSAYGAFALGLTVLLFLFGFHDAFVLEPMSVLGPGSFAESIKPYLRSQLALSLRISGVLALPPLLAGGVLTAAGNGSLGWALLGAGIAVPPVLTFWLARRMLYLVEQPGRAAAGSAVSFFVALGGVLVLRMADAITPLSGFVVMTVAAAVGAWFLLRLGGGQATTQKAAPAWPQLLRRHWAYGRWIAIGTVIALVATQVQMFVAAGMLGLDQAGALRAMQIVTLPAIHAMTAVAALTLPRLASDFGRGDMRSLRRKGMLLTATLTGGAAVWELLLIVQGRRIVQALYGGAFAGDAWLVPIFGLVPVFAALTAGTSLMLRAAQRPQHYLVAAAVTGPAGIVSAAIFTRWWGLGGAAASIVLAYGATAAVAFLLYRAWIKRRGADHA